MDGEMIKKSFQSTHPPAGRPPMHRGNGGESSPLPVGSFAPDQALALKT
jgi:hypothetical protein